MAPWRGRAAPIRWTALICLLLAGPALAALDPNAAQLMFQKAQGFANDLNYDDAIDIYEEILQSFPGTPNVMFSLAFALQQSGRPERAIAIYKDIEAILKATNSPGLDAVYLNMGQILYTRSNVEGSVRYLAKAIIANPSNQDARTNLKTVLEFWDVRDKYTLKRDESLRHVNETDEVYPLRTPETVVIARRRFPEYKPQVCVAGLTCRRLHLFERALSSVIRHMEADEPKVKYEIAWVDNGSERRQRAVLNSRYEVEKFAMFDANYGLSYGINVAFFGMCRAKYMLSIEEDWEWRANVTGQVIRAAMDLLEADERVASVKLRSVGTDAHLPLSELSVSPLISFRTTAVPEGRLWYQLLCRDTVNGKWKGPYSNGGVLLHRERLLREVGPQKEDVPDSEVDYIAAVGKKRFCGAVMRLEPGCDGLHCGAAFDHIGDSQSPGRFDVPNHGGNTIVFHSPENPMRPREEPAPALVAP
eukprot:tig00001333_g8199.t1